MTRSLWAHFANFLIMVGWFWLIWEKQTRFKIADGCCQQFSNVPGSTIKIGLPVVKWKPVSFCETKSGFKLKNFHIWWNLNWFHRFIVILVVFFFVTWFQGPKISYFWLKITISGVSSLVNLKPTLIIGGFMRFFSFFFLETFQ